MALASKKNFISARDLKPPTSDIEAYDNIFSPMILYYLLECYIHQS